MWSRAWEDKAVGRKSDMSAFADAADKKAGAGEYQFWRTWTLG